MDKILFVNACPRPDSRTLRLANTLLAQLSGDVEQVALFDMPLSALDPEGLQKRMAAAQTGAYSDPVFGPAKQFALADTVVIAAPYWDLMFPAALKTYLEMITVAGITFRYSEQGRPESLCRAQRLYYVTTAGGFIGNQNFGFSYIKALAESFFGIRQVQCICAEGLDILGADVEAILQKAQKDLFSSSCCHRTIPYPAKYGDLPGQDGASAFAGMTDHPHSRYYVANDYFHMESGGSLHILSHFRTYQQTTEYTCGAACALMVLNWFGREKYHEQAIGQLIETHPCKGSSVENIADLFDLIGWQVEYHGSPEPKFDTIEQAQQAILQYIDRGIPIMVDWVDWAGHWQVLIGIDTCGTETPYDDVLIFADPYDVTDHLQEGYYTFPLGRFFGMWREGPCAEKSEPYRQPFVAAWPKATSL